MRHLVAAGTLLLCVWSPALAQTDPAAKQRELAQGAWASSLEDVGAGHVSMWHAFDWSQRLLHLEAKTDRKSAVKRLSARLQQLEERVAVRAAKPPVHELAVLAILREEAEETDGPPPAKRLIRLREAASAMVAALRPGDADGLARTLAVSNYLRWQEEPPVKGGITFEDDEDEDPSPAQVRHRERLLAIARRWLRAKDLNPEQRALILLELGWWTGPDRDDLKHLLVDVAERSLQTTASLSRVERLCRLISVPRWSGEGGVLSFGDGPEWDGRRLERLHRVLRRSIKARTLPASAGALLESRRLEVREGPAQKLAGLPANVAQRMARLDRLPKKERAQLVTDLVALLAERQPLDTRRDACWALARLGPPAPGAIQPLVVSCLNDWKVSSPDRFSPPWRPGGGAASALGALGQPAVTRLLKSLEAANPDERSDAIRVLECLARSGRESGTILTWGDGLTRRLLVAWKDPREDLHTEIAEVLAELGPYAAPAAAPLAERMVKDAAVREAGARVLRGLGPFAEAAVPALARALASAPANDPALEDMAEALGHTATPTAAKALATVVNGKGPLAKRRACLAALASCGPLAEDGARAALGDPDLREPALQLLADVGFSEVTAKAIAACLDDPQAVVQDRMAALRALRLNPIPGQVAIPAVERCAGADRGAEDVKEAKRTLKSLGRFAE